MKLRWWLPLVAALGCAAPSVDSRTEAIVYGDDSRREPHESESPLHADIAREQVAVRIVDWAVDQTDPDAPQITYTRTLGESEGLCEGQPFIDQIAPGSCSATLIDRRHLLTAGHCVSDATSCTGRRFWVFGFYLEAGGALAPLDADDIYTCTRVVVSSSADDYAVLELDRDVVGHAPVETRVLAGGLETNTRLSLVGFPNGVPAKVDRGGVVSESVPGDYFVGTVDAFDSSSGSGVFDDEGRLLGVLQRGGLDYVSAGECSVVNVVDPPTPGTGEVMGYLNRALDAYCAAPGVESALCACDGAPCVEPALDAGITERDAGVDAAVASRDAALDAGASPPTGGCRIGPTPASPPWWLVCVALLRLRRRRCGVGDAGQRYMAARFRAW